MINCLVCLSSDWVQWNKHVGFFIHHLYNGITIIVNNFDNILIWLCVVRQESLKVGFNIPEFEHYSVELCPHYLLCFYAFKLHVENCNGHDFAIFQIINMTSHHCLTSNSFYMVKHDPRVLQITPELHSCNKPNSTPNLIDGHLEKKDLLTRYLA